MGRSPIWVKDAPHSPMKRAEWVLDNAAGLQLDDAISYRCPSGDETDAKSADAEPSFRGFVAERIDVVTPGHAPSTFYLE